MPALSLFLPAEHPEHIPNEVLSKKLTYILINYIFLAQKLTELEHEEIYENYSMKTFRNHRTSLYFNIQDTTKSAL